MPLYMDVHTIEGDELGTGLVDVVEDQVQAPDRAGGHAGEILEAGAEDEGAGGVGWGQRWWALRSR